MYTDLLSKSVYRNRIGWDPASTNYCTEKAMTALEFPDPGSHFQSAINADFSGSTYPKPTVWKSTFSELYSELWLLFKDILTCYLKQAIYVLCVCVWGSSGRVPDRPGPDVDPHCCGSCPVWSGPCGPHSLPDRQEEEQRRIPNHLIDPAHISPDWPHQPLPCLTMATYDLTDHTNLSLPRSSLNTLTTPYSQLTDPALPSLKRPRPSFTQQTTPTSNLLDHAPAPDSPCPPLTWKAPFTIRWGLAFLYPALTWWKTPL